MSFCAQFALKRPIIIELTDYTGEKLYFNLTTTSTLFKKSFVASKDAQFKLNYLIGNVKNGGNVTPAGEHAILLDDINIKVVLASPILAADTTENKLSHDMDITFTDNQAWRSAVTSVTVEKCLH